MSNAKLIVGGVIIAVCTVALVAATTGTSLDFYNSVTEFQKRAESGSVGTARVRGLVRPDSVHHDAAKLDTEFTIADANASLRVFYHGVLPSSFEPGSDLVVQGNWDSARKLFVANQLMFKCPSKYESRKGS